MKMKLFGPPPHLGGEAVPGTPLPPDPPMDLVLEILYIIIVELSTEMTINCRLLEASRLGVRPHSIYWTKYL